MQGHPGGDAHTRYLIELSFLPPGSRWLDMGAGDGQALDILEEEGFSAVGIDLSPRSLRVERGDFLRTPYETGSFDGALSQCSFYVSGNVPLALTEAARLLRKGGKLVFSDVTEDVVVLLNQVRAAGFAVRHLEDLTDQWKQYYLEALWREEVPCPPVKGTISYVLFVCERM